MEKILGNIYCWFESLFGQNLAEYLWGYNCDAQDYSGINLFNSIGLITIIFSLVFVLAYYYLPLILLNHPRCNRWWNWLIILLISSAICGFIAYGWIINDLLNGTIGECLMYTKDNQGNILAQLINKSDCYLFGFTNFILSSIIFVLWSIIFKWWSPNCKHSPCL
jgi:hypothetical protein